MRVLDLFSGVGGFSLGLERAGMETVAFCEFDKKAQLVLKKHWPDVPIYDDVRELTYDKLKEDGIVGDSKRQRRQGGELHKGDIPQTLEGGQASSFIPTSEGRKTTKQTNSRKQASTVDLICGGFPCQPFSVAGKQKGDQDDRHLWPEYFRLIQEIRPRWVIGENVAGLINLGLDEVLSDLESADYSCQTLIIPACAVNAPHRRDRVWVIAYSDPSGIRREQCSEFSEGQQYRARGKSQRVVDALCQDVADSRRESKRGKDKPKRTSDNLAGCGSESQWQDASYSNRVGCKDPLERQDQVRQFKCGDKQTEGREQDVDNADSTQCEGGSIPSGVYPKDSNFSGRSKDGNAVWDVADSECKRQSGQGKPIRPDSTKTDKVGEASGLNNGGERSNTNWDIEPDVGRVAHAIPNRVDRLKQLGNAVVPQIVEQIGRAIMEIENAGNNKSENS